MPASNPARGRNSVIQVEQRQCDRDLISGLQLFIATVLSGCLLAVLLLMMEGPKYVEGKATPHSLTTNPPSSKSAQATYHQTCNISGCFI